MNTNSITEKLCLKNIYELLGERFYIPAYQRGYRWSDIQVRELLDDIWEFSQQPPEEKSPFYCLQPIVVNRNGEHWELVDGQQRITTLYIILHFLEKEHLRRELREAYKKPLYSIEYETRGSSLSFIQDIKPSEETDNIDFYHIAKAYEVITEWFSAKDFRDNNALIDTLLAKPNDRHSVKVIWYDLSDECLDNDYAIDVFSRLNTGKIPLTNAELVKALFLQRGHFSKEQVNLKQIQIASEWDSIEKQLQEPDFWHFIYNSGSRKKYDTRIEYIFDLMKGKDSNHEPYFTFHQFSGDFKQSTVNIDQLWKDIKDYFLTFDAWYRDRELYHLIGFLVENNFKVSDLKARSESPEMTKRKFKIYLKDLIREKFKKCQLDDLRYHDKLIKPLLLLFNIQTLLSTKEADTRFPFDRYKSESWDIEHIRSQTDDEPSGDARIAWLKDLLEYAQSHSAVGEYINQIESLLPPQKMNDPDFDKLYQEICDHFKVKEIDWVDDLGNLALLDAKTNRSYKNALFPIKRTRIIQNDMLGVFVPICTKNVFLKFYSQSSSDLMFWQESDSQDYMAAIFKSLAEYLPEQGNADG